MVKRNKLVLSTIVSASLVAGLGMAVYAVPGGSNGGTSLIAPSGQSAPGGAMGASGSVSYSGATVFSADTTASESTYNSTTGGQNALLISGGEVNLNKVTVSKSGDENSENSDFYGTNAGILVYNGGKLNLSDSTVSTGGAHANAVFAYGEGSTIDVKNTTITTTGNNSGGVMVTGGGTLTAENLTVETSGNSSAAIRSDRGGGTMTVSGGSYKTSGVGSPAIYSTANISVKDAELEATASEGVVIEGNNSVSLDTVSLVDTNTTLNGNSETYKNVFIYQSMSGDADEGAGTFSAKDTMFVTNKGDTFFVTNTEAVINLEDNNYRNSDSTGVFLRAQAGKWGTSGKNGGTVSVNLTNDEVKGDVELDDISSVTFNLSGGSYLRGKLTGGSGNNIVKLSDASSVWILEGDVELQFLEDADTTFQNIYANGHTLKVNGEVVSINQGAAPEHKANYDVMKDPNASITDLTQGAMDQDTTNRWEWLLLTVIAGAWFVAAITTTIVMIATYNKPSKKKKAHTTQDPINMVE
ncbi:hypothetical protein IKG16_02470 [Candidatus Saccharibacteria bacterium]|nr:hypothetical protein [Candidatus Saccharibacteria bacterium]